MGYCAIHGRYPGPLCSLCEETDNYLNSFSDRFNSDRKRYEESMQKDASYRIGLTGSPFGSIFSPAPWEK